MTVETSALNQAFVYFKAACKHHFLIIRGSVHFAIFLRQMIEYVIGFQSYFIGIKLKIQ